MSDFLESGHLEFTGFKHDGDVKLIRSLKVLGSGGEIRYRAKVWTIWRKDGSVDTGSGPFRVNAGDRYTVEWEEEESTT